MLSSLYLQKLSCPWSLPRVRQLLLDFQPDVNRPKASSGSVNNMRQAVDSQPSLPPMRLRGGMDPVTGCLAFAVASLLFIFGLVAIENQYVVSYRVPVLAGNRH